MRKKIIFTFLLLIVNHLFTYSIDTWIRINQLGYLPEGIKKAIIISETPLKLNTFTVHDALTGNEIIKLNNIVNFGAYQNFKNVYILNFSGFKQSGAFYIKAGNYFSPTIYINKNIYDHTADFILNYFRQQRCGLNQALKIKCHLNDGNDGVTINSTPFSISDSDNKNKQNKLKSKDKKDTLLTPQYMQQVKLNHMDATGGWHTGLGFSKNGAITAHAVLNMLLAYQINPDAFEDEFDESGNKIRNGVPDILDEAKWGLNWLIKLNPGNDIIYHQVGDDRDIIENLKPENDSLNYGYGIGKGRHIYKATGKPQGLLLYQNQSNGLASVAGKYAAVFALASEIFSEKDVILADSLQSLSERIYNTGKKFPGVTQSVPGKTNSFIEEDNWNDDMELAATQLYHLTFSGKYLKEAVNYGRMEPVVPWIFADSVNYYQWFPFTNLGHLTLASLENPDIKNEFLNDIKTGLSKIKTQMSKSPFLVSIPMTRNSNNYIISLATQCILYREYSADTTFTELETALNDWIFGCNLWGTSMVVGLPENGKYPSQPSCYQYINQKLLPLGAMISGPVKKSEYLKEFGKVINPTTTSMNSNDFYYTDQSSDFVTNTPTFDGSASLMYYLSICQSFNKISNAKIRNTLNKGCIIRTDSTKKIINLVFVCDEYPDGLKTIKLALKKNHINASFFVSGKFLREKSNQKEIIELYKSGNYIGPNTDKNLVACDVKNTGKLLVAKEEFLNDLKNNYLELNNAGIKRNDALIFYPAKGIFNDSISKWCKETGMKIVSKTPGTISFQDISNPEMRDNYFSSIEIYNQIFSYEKNAGLNGHLLVFHSGADKKRTDKFYKRLSSLISELKQKGYEFKTLNETTELNDLNALHKKKT